MESSSNRHISSVQLDRPFASFSESRQEAVLPTAGMQGGKRSERLGRSLALARAYFTWTWIVFAFASGFFGISIVRIPFL